jgi:hypothetical protein
MPDILPTKIHIDHGRYSTVLGILAAIAAGESSPLFLEERARELGEYIPFLKTAISWMGEAMERLSDAKNRDVGNDPDALRDFLAHQDMVARAQGAIAALLCVAESLRSDEMKEEKKVSPKRKSRKKPPKS